MNKFYDVCIRGAGIVGRTLALHLANQRLRVVLVKQPQAADSAHHDVRAYALSPASKALLEGIRCWPDAAHATAVRSMQVEDVGHGKSSQVRFDAVQQGSEALNWVVDVPELERLLAQAVAFQPLITVTDQPQAAAALTVVCEGRMSHTRAEFGVAYAVTPYPQSALAARIANEIPHQQTARQWAQDGDILALLPLDGAAGQRYALVWSLSPQRAQALQSMEPQAFCQALEDASHGVLAASTLLGERQLWPLQAARARQWVGTQAQGGSWALAGDAAHSVHPLTGQGLNLGLGDAAELIKVLGNRPYWRNVSDMRLLRAYARARQTELAILGGSTDVLQQLFTHPSPTVQTLRHWGLQMFNHSGPLKHWVVQQAMGGSTATKTPSYKAPS